MKNGHIYINPNQFWRLHQEEHAKTVAKQTGSLIFLAISSRTRETESWKCTQFLKHLVANKFPKLPLNKRTCSLRIETATFHRARTITFVMMAASTSHKYMFDWKAGAMLSAMVANSIPIWKKDDDVRKKCVQVPINMVKISTEGKQKSKFGKKRGKLICDQPW